MNTRLEDQVKEFAQAYVDSLPDLDIDELRTMGARPASILTAPERRRQGPTMRRSPLLVLAVSFIAVLSVGVFINLNNGGAPGGNTAATLETGMSAPSADESTPDGAVVEPSREQSGFVCPVTVPDGSFSPPEGYPDPRPGDVWFGDADLWTVLPMNGAYAYRESVWWSQNFPGASEEQEPPIAVVWERIDVEAEPITVFDDTFPSTPEEGWSVGAGIDPEQAGCFEVTGWYRGAVLSYVYEQN